MIIDELFWFLIHRDGARLFKGPLQPISPTHSPYSSLPHPQSHELKAVVWYLTIAFQKSLLQLLIDKMSPNFSVCMQEPERCRLPAALWSSVTFTLVNDATSILVQADAVLDALFILSYCCCSVLMPSEVLCFSVGFFLQQLSSAS